jgi:hypothetical protein
MPATATRKSKTTRTLRILAPGLVRITETAPRGKQKVEYYAVKEITVDFGRGFEFAKFGGDEAHHVHVDEETGHTCDCKGFVRWAHCRHLSALLALLAKV